jgi:hypothetical protein
MTVVAAGCISLSGLHMRWEALGKRCGRLPPTPQVNPVPPSPPTFPGSSAAGCAAAFASCADSDGHSIDTTSPRKCYRVNHRSYLGVMKIRVIKTGGEADIR